MKPITSIERHHGRYLPWAAGSAAFIGLAGTLWALSEVLENDTDGDGWTDTEEIVAGTNPADETDPWDSDGDGIADYLEFADGTDPLDPNDPPRIRKSVLTYSVAAASNEATNISLESLKSGSQQNMYHNTAWFGKRLNYTFFRPTADSKWQAINGNEIEYWSTGYYDLLARNGSSGIAITVENVPAGKYTLKWKHMQRPDGGSPGYTVSVSGATTASKSFTAPKTNSEGEVHEASLTFEVNERGTLVLSFDAGNSGTSGPLVGSIALLETFGVIKVDWNADIGGQEFKVTQDSGAAFTGSDWESSRKRQTNPVAFSSGSNLKLIPTLNESVAAPPTAIRAQVTLGNSTKTYTLPWAERGKGFSIPAPVPTGTVGYFENVQVSWSVSYDSEAWEDAGSSTHEIYFTRGTPQAGLAQETLFWVACSSCHGKSTDADIIDGIWSKFSTGSGPANLCRRDGTPMKYWGEKIGLMLANGEDTAGTSALIKWGDGQCGAWARFFADATRLNSIQSTFIVIHPLLSNEVMLINEYHFETTILNGFYSHRASLLLVPIHSLSSLSSTLQYCGNGLAIDYSYVDKNKSMHNRHGIAGQNNQDPFSIFSDHAIVKIGDNFYDPSYGLKASTELEWESASLAGFALTPQIGLGVVEISCRQRPHQKRQTSFEHTNE